ncbi:SusD/RagB family nutrient-binding outer membrane lipoprotein [Flavobacterium sp. NG2]|uniref:SusD/RagB family nutrient-binding outer membrane lipoprotein n=1 Tax=Flavobacterium sp. NG2 TaxID=3097547 RepID=UPI002A812465|nr:SusD/RagB family nutrient-binding outer membrane lipoprotein [Flavobacterium sp. NG2]WPR71705.1 SusD/RagB family nutrient-binding outer membrane lipoprotein [Flavobacterium sp. NG2]
MKNILQKTYKILIFTLFLGLQSCETTDIELKENPNNVSNETADVDLYLNSIQLGLANFITGYEGENEYGMSELGMKPVRMLHQNAVSYRDFYSPSLFDKAWKTAYSKVLTDIRAMTPLALKEKKYTHVAIGQIIESYVMMTLVDYFGDVPYTEAIKGTMYPNPKVDSGASIYKAIDLLLIDAISNLEKNEVSLPSKDLYYNGGSSKENWIKVAKTIRLKLYLQTRIANSPDFGSLKSKSIINELIQDNDLILTSSEDFLFKWSTNSSAPDSRHPYFEKNFGGSGPSSNFYMANYYMDLMANKYPNNRDPRIRYYFYRQRSDFSTATVVTKSCVTQNQPAWYGTEYTYCTVPSTNGLSGYWGRDHGDNDGIPPDERDRTLFGVYPVGGEFDKSDFENLSGSDAPSIGLKGAGITPILMSSFTYFMLAEASLTIGTTGNPLEYLEAGMRESITTTMEFGSSVAKGNSRIPTTTAINDYINAVKDEFNAGNNSKKLEIIVQQYFIALWTNGIEAYNTYRRTGKPEKLQLTVKIQNPGIFIRSNWYPQTTTSNNSNIKQKAGVSTPVFWDTNPEGFVD